MEARFSRKPELLLGVADQNPEKTITIDEVQKIPKILDVGHSILSKQKRQFILMGSSVRRIKRGGANLLAGRASVKEIFPLTHLELVTQFDLQEAFQWGTLPELFSISSASDKREGFFLEQYSRSARKWVMTVPKFYFFDGGVARALAGTV